MPTYEYVCKSCGENIEVFQSFSDRPLKKHKVCGGDLQKVFHARGIVFKGGGFYATDSKASSSTKGSSDSSSSDNGGAKENSGKSDKSGKSESGKSEKTSAKASSTSSSSSSSDSD